MQTIIWAFGAMLILMLIVAFIPIGITLRGKTLVVITSFVLALGGLAAVTTFSLWQTALIILLLSLVTAYIMNSRLEKMIFNQQVDSVEDENDESPVSLDIVNQSEKTADLDFLDLGEIEIKEPSIKANDIQEGLSLEPQPQLSNENDDFIEQTVDEDISFLHDRTETDLVEINEEPETESSYLADIESLIFNDPVKSTTPEDDYLLEEIVDKKDVKIQEEKVDYDDETDLEELFFAIKEAAASNEDSGEESNIKKPVDLQK
ncbi:hypothetical protein [Neobacillus rhizophilus]|uniref:Uncharacterized protein n=1 Tax=Neobacillus rhizophilus TaxID=2833579 RepID=A0A942UAN3_9BACI|nr:hypothetical protein [Neobacillus rhizophilus]MBS4215471.1 hypothetical protein [Neobacillus rhizophilus]